MRLALIARGCRPGAGIERYTHELAERLAGRHEVHVLTDPREAVARWAKILPVTAPRHPHWYSILTFSAAAGRRALREQYDLVHAMGSDATWGDVVTAHSCHAAGMRASLKLDPGPINRLRKFASPAHRAVLSLEAGTFLRARRIIAVSRRVARQVRASYPGVARAAVCVVYPGVDVRALSPAVLAPRRAVVRRSLGLAADAVVFALVANAPRLKGAGRLIAALARTRDPRAHLLIASADGRDRQLAAAARRAGLERRVHWLPSGRDARPAFAAADVYAALPEYESFGLAVLEAAACGLPILLGRNAGAAELLADGRDALLLPALAGPERVAAALDRLAGDAVLRARLGAAARKVAEAHTWDRMAAEVEAVYVDARAEKPNGARNAAPRRRR